MKNWIKDDKFVELTPDELKGLSTDDLAAYASDKNKHQIEKSISEFKDEYKTIAEKAAEGKLSKDDVDSELKDFEEKLNKEMQKYTDDQIESLTKKFDEVEEELKKAQLEVKSLKDGGLKSEDHKKGGFGTIFRKALEEKELIETYEDKLSGRKSYAMKGYDSKDTRVSLKAAIDMTTALALTPGATPGTAIGYLTDYGKMRDVMINLTMDDHVISFLPTDPVSDKYMGVLIEYDYTDGSGTKAEGSASSKSSIKFQTKEFKVFTIATHFRVSKENLADIDRLESKLNRIAPDKILSQLDSKVLSATGDNSTDIEGMYVSGNYTAFSAATYAATVESANLIDLIRKMKLQATVADQDVNAVILHPSRIDEIESLKDADRNYLQSRGIVFDNEGRLVRVHGLAVIKNKKQTVDRVTVMWNESAEIGLREDINFEVGLDGTDLTEGMRTIVFEMRAAFGVGKPGGIIVSTDPDTDIGTITKVVA